MQLTLTELQEQLQQWNGCALAEHANPVLGEGDPHARVMFIGEAPGKKEDELKRPFVGPAGKLLDELLQSIGLKRNEVYISNVVKYRPPDNRDPTDEEKQQCMPWLQLEIAIIQPEIIVPLGRHALGHFLPRLGMTAAHGKPHVLAPQQNDAKSITIFPIYHPAAALHNGNLRQTLFDDFAALKQFLDSHSPLPTPDSQSSS